MSSKTKQIAIKPIETILPKQHDEGIEQQDIQTSLIESIARKKAELSSIEAEQTLRIEEANRQIQAAKDNWNAEKEKLTEEARQAGFEQGYAEGKQEAFQQYENTLQQANTIVEAAQEDYHQIIEKNTESIVEIAMAVAGKILHHEIEEQPACFTELVKKAIEDVKSQPDISILVHPDYYHEVHAHQEELQYLVGDKTNLSIQADSHLNETDCIISHPYGQVEASVDTQLEKIREAVMEFVMESGQ